MTCDNCGKPAEHVWQALKLCTNCVRNFKLSLQEKPSPQDVYQEALQQQTFEIRVWKEAFGQGFTLGFSAGRDGILDKN